MDENLNVNNNVAQGYQNNFQPVQPQAYQQPFVQQPQMPQAPQQTQNSQTQQMPQQMPMMNNMSYPPQPPYGMPPKNEKVISTPMSILSLVCGIVSFITFWFWYVAVPFAMGGIALGLSANSKGTKNSPMALTGIILSAIGFASAIVKLLAVYSLDF